MIVKIVNILHMKWHLCLYKSVISKVMFDVITEWNHWMIDDIFSQKKHTIILVKDQYSE